MASTSGSSNTRLARGVLASLSLSLLACWFWSSPTLAAHAQEVTTTIEPPTTVVATTVTTAAPPTTAPPVTTAAPTTVKASTTTAKAAPTSTPTTVAGKATIPTVIAPVISEAPTSSTSSTETTIGATTSTVQSALLVAGPNDTSVKGEGSSDDGLTPATKLRLIVAGLVAVAVLISILTVAYWRHTRPYEWEEWDDEDDDAAATFAASGATAGGARVAAAEPVVMAPVVPPLIPADLFAPRGEVSSVDEPTAAFEPPGMVATSSPIITSSLPIVTLEDIERSTPSGATDAVASPAVGEPSADAPVPDAEPAPVPEAAPVSEASLDTTSET